MMSSHNPCGWIGDRLCDTHFTCIPHVRAHSDSCYQGGSWAGSDACNYGDLPLFSSGESMRCRLEFNYPKDISIKS